jgi:protein gp37
MALESKIGWTDHTFNPWLGCKAKGEGCRNCYAKAMWRRCGIDARTRRATVKNTWRKILNEDRKCAEAGTRQKVFPSLCDPFETFSGFFEDKDRRWGTLEECKQAFFHEMVLKTEATDWLLLTKRPDGAARYFLKSDGEFTDRVWLVASAWDHSSMAHAWKYISRARPYVRYLGLSLEPLIGEVDISRLRDKIDWVIVGGESGPCARPCKLEWIKDVWEQCQHHGIRCFIKQMGDASVTEDIDLWEPEATHRKWFLAPWGGFANSKRIIWTNHANRDEFPAELNHQQWPLGVESWTKTKALST